MAINEKFGTLHTEKVQRDSVIEARAVLQNVRGVVAEAVLRIQEIADSGSFDTVDNEIKSTLLKGKTVAENAQTGFEDSDLAELLDWSR